MKRAEKPAPLLALASFATLSIGDAVGKSMAGQWSPFAIAGLRYALATSLLTRTGIRYFPVIILELKFARMLTKRVELQRRIASIET